MGRRTTIVDSRLPPPRLLYTRTRILLYRVGGTIGGFARTQSRAKDELARRRIQSVTAYIPSPPPPPPFVFYRTPIRCQPRRGSTHRVRARTRPSPPPPPHPSSPAFRPSSGAQSVCFVVVVISSRGTRRQTHEFPTRRRRRPSTAASRIDNRVHRRVTTLFVRSFFLTHSFGRSILIASILIASILIASLLIASHMCETAVVKCAAR